MNIFGVQFLGKNFGMPSREVGVCHESADKHTEIREVLRRFQNGYTERNIENVDAFMEELFINGEEICVLGTGTGELFLGSEQVKNLIRDDWKYWGDASIDWENAHISVKGEVAWFATMGHVKYTFADSLERYDRYLDLIKDKSEEKERTPKERVAFINWVLSLTYHQRVESEREYLWPLCLSGVLLKDGNKWRIAHLQFSIQKANFPDERFENSKEHLENYNKQNAITDGYKNNQMTLELKDLLKKLETELIGQKDISKKLISKYFAADSMPYIIGPENQWYYGIDQIRDFFAKSSDANLILDLEHAIASRSDEVTWVTVTGMLKQVLNEDKLAESALEELNNLFQTNLTSKEKLFAAHRSMAYVLKESAAGANYTCPIRLTSVISNISEGYAFQHIHFSFPFYWILEGKLDGISEH